MSYSGPGSSVATGGSNSSSSSSGSDTVSSSEGSGSQPAYSGPGSSLASGALDLTTPIQPEDDDPPGTVSMNLPGTRDLLERDTVSGGTTQAARRDYVYSPTAGGFVREIESNQFAPRSNNIELFGGTSDEFEYNQSSSQTHANERDIKVGESFDITSGFVGPVEEQLGIGDENHGASAELKIGASGEVTVGISGNRNGVEVIGGAGFTMGVEGRS